VLLQVSIAEIVFV